MSLARFYERTHTQRRAHATLHFEVLTRGRQGYSSSITTWEEGGEWEPFRRALTNTHTRRELLSFVIVQLAGVCQWTAESRTFRATVFSSSLHILRESSELLGKIRASS